MTESGEHAELVARRYADAARRLADDPDATGASAAEAGRIGHTLYTDDLDPDLAAVVVGSIGCGNPVAVADLAAGETVLDLGSGAGVDVVLSARRVGPTRRVIELDLTDEMLTLARCNAATAGIDNVEFRHESIEDIPLPDASVDVVISNCVIALSADKPRVFAEIVRVLRPDGRAGISDVVAGPSLTAADRAANAAECLAGAQTTAEYTVLLGEAGLAGISVSVTHEVGNGLHAAIIKARRPINRR